MASAKDLAGIAALAGLGYYLVNRNKKKDEDGSTSVSSAATKAAAKAASDENGRKPTDAENAEIDAAEKFVNPDLPRTEANAKLPTRPGQKTSGVRTTTPSGGGVRPMGAGAGRGGQGGPGVPPSVGSGRGGQGGPSADQIATSRMGGSGRGGQGGPSAKELSNAQYSIRPSQEDQEKAIDAVTGAYGGGPNIKAVAAMAKNAANRGATAARPAMQTGRNSAQQAMDRAMDVEQAAEMAARTSKFTSKPVPDRAPTTDFGFKQALEAQKNVKNQPGYKQMMENEMRDADLLYKRGGRVKAFASGGSVSSASSRGDGIASRGKTRGKMY